MSVIDTYYVYHIIDGAEDTSWPRLGPYKSQREAWIDARQLARQEQLDHERCEGYVVAWCREEATPDLLSRLF